jgi:hypothetical protein
MPPAFRLSRSSPLRRGKRVYLSSGAGAMREDCNVNRRRCSTRDLPLSDRALERAGAMSAGPWKAQHVLPAEPSFVFARSCLDSTP